MKKLIPNLVSIFMGVFAVVGLLLPTATYTAVVLSKNKTESTNGFDLLSFADGTDTWIIIYTIATIVMFALCAGLILLSLVRMVADKKKSNYAQIQTVLAFVLTFVAIFVMFCVIMYVKNAPSINIFSLVGAKAGLGIAPILISSISLVGALLVAFTNKK